MKKPVANRAVTPRPTPCVTRSSRLAPAAPSEHRKISRVGAIASATVNAAESSAPVTKPHCTAIVSHATAPADSCHSARTCGITAVAENHVDINSSAVAVSTTRVARGEGSAMPGE